MTKHQHFKWCLVGFEVAMNDKTLHIVCSLCFLMLLTMVTIVPKCSKCWLAYPSLSPCLKFILPTFPSLKLHMKPNMLHNPHVLDHAQLLLIDTSILGASLGQKHHVPWSWPVMSWTKIIQINPNNDSGHIKHPICIISYHIPMCPPVTAGWILHYKINSLTLSASGHCMDLWLCDRPSLVAQLPHRARRGSPSLLPRAGAWRCYPSCNSAAAVAAPGPWLPLGLVPP